MKKFIYPEINIADLKSEEVMAGVLFISAEGSDSKIIKLTAPDEAAEQYKYWKDWKNNNN